MSRIRTCGAWILAALLASGAGSTVAADACVTHAQAALQALTTGRFHEVVRYLSPSLTKIVTPDALAQTWKQIQGQAGTFQSLGDLHPVTLSGQSLWLASLRFSKARVAALVDCDEADRLTRLRLVPAAVLPASVRQTPASAASTAPSAPVSGVVTQTVEISTPLGPLGGTVTLPEGAGPFPAVVLVHGSGPHDRDERIGPNKPFRDLAIGLARHGVASLRYDKRSFVYGAKVEPGKTFTVDQEVTDDAVAALKVLAGRDGIDARRVFVAGHSLGGMLAPRIAARVPNLAGVVLLAAPARHLLEVSRQQVHESGASDADIATSEAALQAEIALLAKADPAHPPTGEFAHVPQSYWLSLHRYDQVAAARALAVPMLVLQGEADFQVSPDADFGRWKQALGNRDDVAFHTYPGLGHLFMKAGPHHDVSDYRTPGHVDPQVIADIARWIASVPAATAPVP